MFADVRTIPIPNDVATCHCIASHCIIDRRHVPFTLIYHPLVTFSGLHASYAMNAFRAICLAPIALKAIRKSGSYVFKSPLSKEDDDSIIYRQLFIYVFGIVLVALACTPEDEVRTSFSQECCSDCKANETSFWGAFNRTKYACDERNNWFEQTGQGHLIEDRYSTPPPTWKYDKYKLLDDKCLNSYSEGDVESTWITVVGTAKDEQFDMLIVVHAVCVLGLGMLPFVRSGPSAEKKKSE